MSMNTLYIMYPFRYVNCSSQPLSVAEVEGARALEHPARSRGSIVTPWYTADESRMTEFLKLNGGFGAVKLVSDSPIMAEFSEELVTLN